MDTFTIGVILLVINIPLGWLGAIVCALLYVRFKKKAFILLGGGIYVLTWGMLFLGAYLAKDKGIVLAKETLRVVTNDPLLMLAISLMVIVSILYVLLRMKSGKTENTQ